MFFLNSIYVILKRQSHQSTSGLSIPGLKSSKSTSYSQTEFSLCRGLLLGQAAAPSTSSAGLTPPHLQPATFLSAPRKIQNPDCGSGSLPTDAPQRLSYLLWGQSSLLPRALKSLHHLLLCHLMLPASPGPSPRRPFTTAPNTPCFLTARRFRARCFLSSVTRSVALETQLKGHLPHIRLSRPR